MSITYFIDSENVGDHWISLLNTATSEDTILVFYTSKSPHMNYKNVILLKESLLKVDFIECCEGNNALDFQLSTDLGYRIHDLSDDNEYIIISNDTGFDAIVTYWNKQNKSVKRVSCKTSKPTLSITSNNASKITTYEALGSSNGVDDNAKELLYLIGKNNLQDLHEALKQLYDNKKSKTIYNAFKSDAAYNSFISKHKPLSLLEKHKLYCSIVFSIMAPAETMPKDFPSYLLDSWEKNKNLNSLKSLLQQKYGKEKTDKYYSLFKVHIKILDKIK